jgi:hypothetical protein
MHRNHVGILARLSTILLLTLAADCSSGASHGSEPGVGGRAGSGGAGSGGSSDTGGGGAGTGSGGSIDTGGARAGGAGSGGSIDTGGASAGGTGNGGSADTGGISSSGGGSGGTGGTGDGNGGAPSGSGGAGGGTSSFAVNVELSTAIPTVGIVTWSLDAPIDSATIDFGRDQSTFELQAPVDLQADNHRTLLLGMKQDTTYYVRVTATGGGQTHVSSVATVKTGALPTGLPVPKVTDHNASALYAGGGFTVTCMGYPYSGASGGSTPASFAFIFDRDGDIVWAYDLSKTVASECTRARMSLDGRSMWAGSFSNTTSDGALMRISMDGLGTPETYSLPGRSHDFAVLPDEHIVYFARDNLGSGMAPESIFELDPTTSKTRLIYSEVADFGDVFQGSRGGHTNQVNYAPELKAISFSMYFINTIALVSYPDGQLLATFGGDKSTFSSMSWSGQHGHDVYPDHITLFNNSGSNGGASVLRFKYDLQAKTATEEASYSSGLSSPALGDVKELPNGNYYVTYSTSGALHELDSSMKLLREVEIDAAIAYAEHRASLYGPPPPYDR